MPTQKSLKRNLYEKNIWREISPPKKCSNNLSSKNSTKLWGDILCQKKNEDKSLPNNCSSGISLQNNEENIYKKKSEKTISTKKREKNHLHQKICTQSWQETWQNSELMRSGKNVFFNESSSLSILAIFQLIQFDFCWRRFLLNVFWWQKHVLRFPGVCMFLFFPFFASYFPNLHVF